MTENDSEPAGWAVVVKTKRLGGGTPTIVMYASVFKDADEAVAAVKKQLSMNGDHIDKSGPLSKETIASLGLATGQVRML